MNGLEKIISTIDEQSDTRAKAARQEARESAEKIISDAKAQARNDYDSHMSETEERCRIIANAAQSAAISVKNKTLLNTRVECIYEAINTAVKTLENLPDDEYFELLQRLVKSNAEAKDGELLLNSRDLNRLPPDFINCVNGSLSSGKLTVCPDGADIDGGFILKYGDIEINCSFSAIAASKADRLKDTAAKVLFVN